MHSMRYSAKHKAQTRAKLVKKAAEGFRDQGLQGTGIAKLMSQMGLTHGGFYGHFDNKDELVVAALAEMFADNIEHMRKAVEGAPKGEEAVALVNAYLSPQHRDHPADGCLLPLLAPEIAHQPLSVRKAYTKGFQDRIDKFAQFIPGASENERQDRARIVLAGMAGTMMFARALSDRELSDRMLAQGREFFSSVVRPSAGKKA
jgi:TetR/AcrR family transcriptional regulator, transcriptional repressor for nem operon